MQVNTVRAAQTRGGVAAARTLGAACALALAGLACIACGSQQAAPVAPAELPAPPPPAGEVADRVVPQVIQVATEQTGESQGLAPDPGPAQNHSPRFFSVEFDARNRSLEVKLNDPDLAEEVTLHAEGTGGLLASPGISQGYNYPSGGEGEYRTRDYHWIYWLDVEAADPFAGADGAIHLWAVDKAGHRSDYRFGVPYALAPVEPFPYFALAPDTLYAMPLSESAAVGEEVTILVATGIPAMPFKYMAGVGLVLPADAKYVPLSFDNGMPDAEPDLGGAFPLDGIWAIQSVPLGMLMAPDQFIQATDIGDGLRRWDFNVTPLGGPQLTRASGALFNARFKFSAPGLKKLAFQQVQGVKRTYYDDHATEHFWSDITNDHSGIANSITVN